MLNPFFIYLTTRGSSDSIIIFLLVTMIWAVKNKYYMTAGILYGLSTHWRIYPIIFCLSLFLYIDNKQKKFITKNKLTFTLTSALTFLMVSGFAVYLYPEYLYDGLLYHFIRVDPRHNYSPFFLPTYL